MKKDKTAELKKKVEDAIDKAVDSSIFGIPEEKLIENLAKAVVAVGEVQACRDAAKAREQEYVEAKEKLSAEGVNKELTEKVKDLEARLYRSYCIDASDAKEFQKWQKEHNIAKHGTGPDGYLYTGAAGGQFEYSFWSCGLGTVTTCRCPTCYRNMWIEAGKRGITKESGKDYEKLQAEFDASHSIDDF